MVLIETDLDLLKLSVDHYITSVTQACLDQVRSRLEHETVGQILAFSHLNKLEMLKMFASHHLYTCEQASWKRRWAWAWDLRLRLSLSLGLGLGLGLDLDLG